MTDSTSALASCGVDPHGRSGMLLETHEDKRSRTTICDWGTSEGSVFNGLVVGWYSQLSSCRQQKILALFFRGYSPWSCYISPTLSDQSRAPHSCLVKSARALNTRPTKRYVSQVQALGIRNNRSSRHWSFPRRRFSPLPEPISSALGC